MLPLLIALALAQAGSAPSPASAAADRAGLAAATSAAAADTPAGAPAADYDFVAWCEGALSGHMALYEQVKPELDSIQRPAEAAANHKGDVAQMAAGREYLALYRKAIKAAQTSKVPGLKARAFEAEAQGEAIWAPARSAEPRTRMWSWLLWDLPGRCETAAKHLQTRAGLAGLALRTPAARGADAPPPPRAPNSIDDALTPTGTPAPTAPAPAANLQ